MAYNDTLDDPIGMVHIRDLIAFMTARAAVDPEKNTKRKKPFVAGLDLKAIDLALPLSTTSSRGLAATALQIASHASNSCRITAHPRRLVSWSAAW